MFTACLKDTNVYTKVFKSLSVMSSILRKLKNLQNKKIWREAKATLIITPTIYGRSDGAEEYFFPLPICIKHHKPMKEP